MWARIAVRVAGSWIGATGVLWTGWVFHGLKWDPMPAKSTSRGWRFSGCSARRRSRGRITLFISYTDVRLYPDRMEVKCSLASFTALMLENPNPTNALPVLDDDNFTSFEPMFKRQGARLFEMTAGE